MLGCSLGSPFLELWSASSLRLSSLELDWDSCTRWRLTLGSAALPARDLPRTRLAASRLRALASVQGLLERPVHAGRALQGSAREQGLPVAGEPVHLAVQVPQQGHSGRIGVLCHPGRLLPSHRAPRWILPAERRPNPLDEAAPPSGRERGPC